MPLKWANISSKRIGSESSSGVHIRIILVNVFVPYLSQFDSRSILMCVQLTLFRLNCRWHLCVLFWLFSMLQLLYRCLSVIIILLLIFFFSFSFHSVCVRFAFSSFYHDFNFNWFSNRKMDKMHMHTFNAQLLTKYQSIKVQDWAFPEVENTDNNHFTRLICIL